MRTDGHVSIAPADVGAGSLQKYATRQFAANKMWVVAVGLGPPRLWSFATNAVLDGFAKGLTSAGAMDAPGQLQAGYSQARRALVHACNSLIERTVPDVAFLGLAFDHTSAHVIVAGSVRAYLHQGRQPQRMSPREQSEGMLEGQPLKTSAPINAGDLILAGSESAFSTRAVGRVAAVLQTDPKTPPSVLATLLTDPARKAGVGAAAVVLRAR